MAEEIKIRTATAEDMDEIMKIALAACEENGFLNPNPSKLAAFASRPWHLWRHWQTGRPDRGRCPAAHRNDVVFRSRSG